MADELQLGKPWATRRISQHRQFEEPIRGSKEAKVIELAIAAVLSTEWSLPEVTEGLSPLHEYLVDQMYQEATDLLLQGDGFRSDM